MKKALILLPLIWNSAFAQTPFYPSLSDAIEAQSEQATIKLREAIVNLRNVYQSSCNLGSMVDCEVAALANMQIALLDMEVKYRANGNSKAKEMASDARSKIDDLSSFLKKKN